MIQISAAIGTAAATVPVWVALAAAGIGAGGAIAGQLVAAIFTARRDNRRLLFDSKQAERAALHVRQEAFREVRRVAFIDLLNTFNLRRVEIRSAIIANIRKGDRSKLEGLETTQDDWVSPMLMQVHSLNLIAPELEPFIMALWEKLAAFENTASDAAHPKFERDQEEIWAADKSLRQEMRRSLGIID